MPDSAIATAADYADAILSARRGKSILVLVLVLMLLIQLAVFFMLRYNVMTDAYSQATSQPSATIDATITTDATTQPILQTSTAVAPSMHWQDFIHYVLGLSTFLGIALSIVLGVALLLILNIMLVGRLVGAGPVTSAYLWTLVLVVLLFPWQSFLSAPGFTPSEATFKIPGVLCTWGELTHPTQGATFATDSLKFAILKWARFVGFPVVALIILLAIQIKSNRGLRQALGESVLVVPPNDQII